MRRQFLWGWARYQDILPRSAQHVIEFCFQVRLQGQLTPIPGITGIEFTLHDENNRYYDEPA
jgi:hypothetical protein